MDSCSMYGGIHIIFPVENAFNPFKQLLRKVNCWVQSIYENNNYNTNIMMHQ